MVILFILRNFNNYFSDFSIFLTKYHIDILMIPINIFSINSNHIIVHFSHLTNE